MKKTLIDKIPLDLPREIEVFLEEGIEHVKMNAECRMQNAECRV